MKTFQGKQRKRGYNVTLVPKTFIEGLTVEHICNPGEEVVIDGVVYVGVT